MCHTFAALPSDKYTHGLKELGEKLSREIKSNEAAKESKSSLRNLVITGPTGLRSFPFQKLFPSRGAFVECCEFCKDDLEELHEGHMLSQLSFRPTSQVSEYRPYSCGKVK